MKIFLIEALLCSNMSYLVTPQKVYLLKSTICFCSQSSIYTYIIRESLHFKCFVYPEKNTYLLLTQATFIYFWFSYFNTHQILNFELNLILML